MPQICLVDPFPDPDRPGEMVSDGSFVDPSRNVIWMVVTAESPPEPPERPLALLFGAILPAGDELVALLEGYGLWTSELADPADQLRQLRLPPLVAAEGELRAAMALSFVSFLMRRNGRQQFLRFVGSAQPGRLDAAAATVYGAGLSVLEEQWRNDVATTGMELATGQFLRLSLRYSRPMLRREIELFAYMLLGLSFTVVFPFVTRKLFDEAIPSGEFRQVMNLLLGLGGVLVLSSVANLRRAYLSDAGERHDRPATAHRDVHPPPGATRDVVRAPTAGRRAGPPVH